MENETNTIDTIDKVDKNDKNEVIFPDDTDRLMSIAEVAARLRTSSPFVSSLVNKGFLSALKFGKNRRIRKVVFNEFLEKNDGKDLQELIKL